MSTYLIWILDSKLILSNDRSNGTLWVLDTCLIVGLRPLIIILMTASLSSKNVQLRLTLRRMCVGWYIIHIWQQLLNLSLFRFSWCSDLVLFMKCSPVLHKFPWVCLPCLAVLFVERNTSITTSQKSRAGNPSMGFPASREMISDSVELCETERCFLHIQLMGTNFRLPKIHKTPPEVDVESSKSPAKSES